MSRGVIRSFPLAYHLCLQSYGSWLPGDPRGWHAHGDGAKTPPRPGVAKLHARSLSLQRYPTVVLTGPMIAAILYAVAETSRARGWRFHAAAAVSSHLHAVLGAPEPGVKVLREIALESARQVSARGLGDPVGRLWSDGGYFAQIHTVAQLERAVAYVTAHRALTFG